jgi:outer membrane protein assembly factor BamA
VGGKTYVIFKAELRIPFFFGTDLAVFVDAGNSWQNLERIKTDFTLIPAMGLALRLRTLGVPISFEYGFNMRYVADKWRGGGTTRTDALGESLGAFHFSIGQF